MFRPQILKTLSALVLKFWAAVHGGAEISLGRKLWLFTLYLAKVHGGWSVCHNWLISILKEHSHFFTIKVNAVQEACAKCFVVQVSKFKILQITWIKNIRHSVFSFSSKNLLFWCFLFCFFMWFARFQIVICDPQNIWVELLVLSWLYFLMRNESQSEGISKTITNKEAGFGGLSICTS